MSSKERSWQWSNQHNGKFWHMYYEMGEMQKRLAELEGKVRQLMPTPEERLAEAMRHLEDAWPLPYSVTLQEQIATEG